MHEYSLVSSLVDEVERQVRVHHAIAVHGVHVRLGELAGVDPALFRTAFEMIQPDTVCARAELTLISEPAVWLCPRCGKAVQPGAALLCPNCGIPARLDGGRDLVLHRLDLEVSDV